VDRRTGSTVATFFADATFAEGAELTLSDDAAQHARVRRMEVGDKLALTNGRGSIASAVLDRLTRSQAVAIVDQVRGVPRPAHLEVFVPVADRDRMLWLAEKSVEIGVSAWQPVFFLRSKSVSPRGEGDAFRSKTRSRMIAALEQSAGAWLPEIHPELSLEECLVRADPADTHRLLLERGGRPLITLQPRAAQVMIGPEGGLEADERSLIVDRHGWLSVSLGETTLRFETAGVVAVGILRSLLSMA
jgi:16S rRNA (uracil1498-N3)-methyltransferase